MAGNTLGARGRYAYTSDTGEVYNITTDVDLATAAGLPAATAGTGSAKPTSLDLRKVFCQATIAGRIVRKALTVNADSALYDTDASATVTIDTVVFTTTGRKGESLSF
jgi:hypothetical protein